jgi:hypothetical protein
MAGALAKPARHRLSCHGNCRKRPITQQFRDSERSGLGYLCNCYAN